jgi:hypothetical protein
MVGTGEDKYQRLAAATKLPKDRQESCAGDFSAASSFLGHRAEAASAAPRPAENEDRRGLWGG